MTALRKLLHRPAGAVLVTIVIGLLFLGLHAGEAGELGLKELAEFAILGLLVARYFVLVREERREAHELGRTKAELERAYGDRESALGASRTGVCLFADGQARFWNPAFLELLEIEGHLPTDWASFLARVQTASTLGDEFAFETAAGRNIQVRLGALGLGEMLVSVDDVTDDVRERATRDEFVAQMVSTQEYDSRRVAEVLHEDVVQQLTALGFGLELATIRSGDDSLAELSASAGQIMSSLRRLLVDLHPAVLESQGLAAAVDVAAAELRGTGVAVDVSPFGERFARTLEQLAYRAVQEAFKNVLAHARAKRVTVGLVALEDVLFCEITNDSQGSSAAESIDMTGHGRLGVNLVRKRIELAGGTFSLRSTRTGGTTFAFTLPMQGVSMQAAVQVAEVA
jgi:signal transduction histidine kinase